MMSEEYEIKTPIARDEIGNALKNPLFLVSYLCVSFFVCLYKPAFFIFLFPLSVAWSFSFLTRFYMPPMRLPADADMIDPSLTRESAEEKKFLWWRYVSKTFSSQKAKGNFFLGYRRKSFSADELWLNDDDLLRHMALFGTTGAGKTEVLLVYYLQSILHGTGNFFMDGKATMALPFVHWSLARRFGREEDVYYLNFITGNTDRFEHIVKQEKNENGEEIINPDLVSNSINLFNFATPTLIINLLQSMLPKVGGDSAQWQESAKSYLEALIGALCYKRARGELHLSKNVIREYLSLHKIVELYNEAIDKNWHTEGYSALESYLNNLAGFDVNLRKNPELWAQEALEQHNYRSGQFLKLLNFFSETYSHIFPNDGGDISMVDVLHNGRLLCVLIPALELSQGEKETIGGMLISLFKMTLTKDLGHNIEGDKEALKVADKKYFGFPLLAIFDELAQYRARGLATLFALMRSLKCAGIIGTQDLASLIDFDKGEAKAIMGNTRTKQMLSIEDMDDTYKMFEKNVGLHNVASVGRMERKEGLFTTAGQSSNEYQVREKSRTSTDELKGMKAGEGVISFEDKIVRSRAFFLTEKEKESEKLKVRLNRFINVEHPTKKTLPEIFPVLQERKIITFEHHLTSLGGLWEALDKTYSHASRKEISLEDMCVILFEQAYEILSELDEQDSPCYVEKTKEFELIM